MMQSKSVGAQSICVVEKKFEKDGRWKFEDGSFFFCWKNFPLSSPYFPFFNPLNAPQPEFGFPDARLARFFEW